MDTQQATILIVDDNPENLKILQQLLTAQGYRIRPAISGEFALHVVRSTPPDLILLDIMMPGIDGFEVCRQLKADERLREIPVIFLSALGDTADKVKAFALGGVDYVTKPLQVEEVLARVRTHLNLRHAQKQLEAKNQQLQAEIAERQQAQAALQESETRYRFLVDNSSDLISKIDRHSMMVFVTEVSRSFIGYAPEEMLNTSCFEYIHPDDQDRVAQALQGVFETGVEAVAEFRARRKDGSFFWAESTGKQVFNAAGESETIAVHRNISERKQMEARLRESEEYHRNLLNILPDGLTIIDLEGRLTFVSPQAYAMYNIPPESDLIGTSVFEWFDPDEYDRLRERIRQLMAKQIARPSEYRAHKYDGSQIWVELSSAPLTDAQGQVSGIMTIIRDISARKRAEEALQNAKDAADAANRTKSIFLASMSHELRTPLNGVLGYAQILKNDHAIEPRQREFAAIIERSGQHLLAMINDILDLAKVEAGRLEIHPARIYLPSLIDDVEGMIAIKAEHKGLRFQTIKEPHLPEYVEGDEHRLHQILLNLLGNAIKFTDHGSVTLRIGLNPNNRPDDGTSPYACPIAKEGGQTQRFVPTCNLYIEISDTGIGIAPDDLKKLFTPFQQVGDTVRKVQGTGLGLAISRNLAELMGGTLTVSSAVGVGSVFRFEVSLPIIVSDTVQAPKRHQIIGVLDVAPTILIVDDLAENRQMLAELLKSWGCRIMEAQNGQEALQQVKTMCPTAIITDLRMPGMDGVELIQHLRQLPACRDLTIIASSASVYQEDQRKSLNAGAQAFLPKPIHANVLSELLSTLGVAKWCYQEETPLAVAANTSEELPPLSTLRAWFALVNIGDIVALREQIADFAQAEGRLTPFTCKIQNLAEHFHVNQIRQIIEEHIEEATRRTAETEPQRESLAHIPAEWFEKLRIASLIADIDAIANVIRDIRPIAPLFADKLEKLAYHFEYDKIVKMLPGNQSQ